MQSRVTLAEVVEEVRSEFFADRVDANLAREILEIETRHVEDRQRAREGVSRAIHDQLLRDDEP